MMFKYLLPIPRRTSNEGSLRILLFGKILRICLQQQQESTTVIRQFCLPSILYLTPYLREQSLIQRIVNILGRKRTITADFLEWNRCKSRVHCLINTSELIKMAAGQVKDEGPTLCTQIHSKRKKEILGLF